MKAVKTIQLILFSIACMLVLFPSCKKETKDEVIDCTGVSPSYNSEIKPIINANCISSGCHNAGSSNGDYTTYAGLKAVASTGTLESRVIINKTMPPSGPLSLEHRKKIKCWISSGASNN
ncbi:MAG: hypothetical protein Q8L90_18825 [Bacteroidota bacterium]|nr:hypothetical protein [Bacteroidota bacterium]